MTPDGIRIQKTTGADVRNGARLLRWLEAIAAPDPASFAVAVGLLFGILFLFFTPPFDTQDEAAHFFRAYAISEGRLRPAFRDGIMGESVPSSLADFASDWFAGRFDVRRELHRPLNPQTRTFLTRTRKDEIKRVSYAAGFYPPTMYLPAALTILPLRLAGTPPLVLLLAVSAVNLLVSTALLWWAVQASPVGRWTLAVLGLLPMCVALRTSASTDGLIISISFLLLALGLRKLESTRDGAEARSLSLICMLSFALSSAKPPYLLIPAAVAGMLLTSGRALRRRISSAGFILIFAVAGTLTNPALYQAFQAENLESQALRRPEMLQHFPQALVNTFIHMTPVYVEQFIGYFEVNVTLPDAVYECVALAILLVALLDGGRIRLLHRIILASAFTSCIVLIAYASFPSVSLRRWVIDGIQGRYFIPIAPLLLLSLSLPGSSRAGRPAVLLPVMITSVGALGAALWSIIERYWLQ